MRHSQAALAGSRRVYYVYEKGARENVQPKFKITQTNYEQYVIKLLNKRKINNQINFLINLDQSE